MAQFQFCRELDTSAMQKELDKIVFIFVFCLLPLNTKFSVQKQCKIPLKDSFMEIRFFWVYSQRHFGSHFRIFCVISFWLWQMLPSLLKIIQVNKGTNVWNLCKCMYLCKAAFNHLLIHPGFSTLPPKAVLILKRKEKYQSYGLNGKVICGDQVPLIQFWWQMTYKR